MKRRLQWKDVGPGLGLAAALLGFSGAVAWAADLLTVTEREAGIRSEKKTYSPKVATVKEGDQVTLLEKDEPWLKVEFQGVQGWINQSSVTDDPNVVLSGTEAARGARATMQSAAQRGFTPEVEREYRSTRPNLDASFRFLDELQKVKYPEEQVMAFLRKGLLIEPAGGGTR
jgi:hypothetical protein